VNKEQTDACRALHQSGLSDEMVGFETRFCVCPFHSDAIRFASGDEILRNA
jgi:hypothetical protein